MCSNILRVWSAKMVAIWCIEMEDFGQFFVGDSVQQAKEVPCLFIFYVVAWGHIENSQPKLPQNPSKWKEITQFTQGKQNTFILSSLLCILENTSQKRNNFGGKSSREQPLDLSVNGIALNWLPVNYSRNKTFFLCLHSLVITEANVWENLWPNLWKPATVKGFQQLENSLKLCQGHQTMKSQKKIISFIKLFSNLTKRKMIYKACIKVIIIIKYSQPRCSQSWPISSPKV